MPKRRLALMPIIAESALRGYLTPKIAQDAKVELRPLVRGLVASKWQAQKPALLASVMAAVDGKLAKDASVGDLAEMLDHLDPVGKDIPDTVEPAGPVPGKAVDADLDEAPPLSPTDSGDDDMAAKIREALAGKLSPEDIDALIALVIPPAATPALDDKGLNADPDRVAANRADMNKPPTKQAMDAAIKKAADEAEARTIARLAAIREAEREVRPYIGELAIAQDSAVAVYRLALDTMKVDHTGITELAGLRGMLKLCPKPGEPVAAVPASGRVALDAKAEDEYRKLLAPNAALKHR
jgi:uncharacterized protein